MADYPDRDLTLDFVKGVLIVVMVVYHAMNIFSTAGEQAFGYVRFVSGSFILISGYIIAIFYERRFQSNRAATSQRLVVRGLKLLTIFTALNVIIYVTGVGNPSKPRLGFQDYLDNLSVIYFSGDPGLVSFQILLPIAYLLIISPLILMLMHSATGLLLATLATAFGFSFLGWQSLNLEFLLLGLVGAFVGIASKDVAQKAYVRHLSVLVVGIGLCIGTMPLLSTNLMLYAVGVTVLLKLIYDLGTRLNPKGVFVQPVIMLGQYSLVAYVAQIVFLQFLARALGREKTPLGAETAFVSILTLVFLMIVCFLLGRLRERHAAIEKSYRFIFS